MRRPFVDECTVQLLWNDPLSEGKYAKEPKATDLHRRALSLCPRDMIFYKREIEISPGPVCLYGRRRQRATFLG